VSHRSFLLPSSGLSLEDPTAVEARLAVGVSRGSLSTALRGSFGFASIWHIQADVLAGESGGGKSVSTGEDWTSYALRGGIHPAITDNVDFVLDLEYAGGEIDNGADTRDIVSYGARTGVRADIGKLELRTFATIASVDPDTSDAVRQVGFLVGGQWNFSDAMSVGLDVDVTGDTKGLNQDNLADLYFRWSF
jgi:hypothetical protein